MAKPRKLFASGGNVVMSLSSSMQDTLGVQKGDHVAVEERDGYLVVSKAQLGVETDD